MASNVYGIPVTNETLKGMTEYHDKKITDVDRAQVALEMKNAEGKDVNARRFAENLQEKKDGILCLFYNATGGPLTLAGVHDTYGMIGSSPYPSRIENGQWGAFLHSPWGSSGSVAQVAYAGKNSKGERREWGIGWNFWHSTGTNYCHVEIQEGHYYNTGTWEQLFKNTRTPEKTVDQAVAHGCMGYASIGSWGYAVFEVIMTLEGVE